MYVGLSILAHSISQVGEFEKLQYARQTFSKEM